MKRKLLKCTGTLTLALALAALSATPALASETGTDAVTGLLSDILVALIGAGSVIAAACIGIRGARKIVKERHAYFTSFSSKGHDLGRFLMQAKEEITIVVIYGDQLLKNYGNLLENLLIQGIRINFLMLESKTAFDMSKQYFGEEEYQYKPGAENAVDRLKKIKAKNIENKKLTIKTWSQRLSASYIAIDCGIEEDQQPKDTAEIHVMLYQYKTPTEKAPLTYMSKDGDASAFEHTVASLKQMWIDSDFLNLDDYFLKSDKKIPASRLSKAIQRLRKKIKHFFKKTVAHSALRCFLL